MLTRKIKARTELLGLSLDDVARISGVPARTVRHWLATGKIPAASRGALASALGVTDAWFDSGPEDTATGVDVLLDGAAL